MVAAGAAVDIVVMGVLALTLVSGADTDVTGAVAVVEGVVVIGATLEALAFGAAATDSGEVLVVVLPRRMLIQFNTFATSAGLRKKRSKQKKQKETKSASGKGVYLPLQGTVNCIY